MKKTEFFVGKFIQECKEFVLSSPSRFCVSVLYGCCLILSIWVILYRRGWDLPAMPSIRFPLIGYPFQWDVDSVWMVLWLLLVMGVGAVKVAARQRQLK